MSYKLRLRYFGAKNMLMMIRLTILADLLSLKLVLMLLAQKLMMILVLDTRIQRKWRRDWCYHHRRASSSRKPFNRSSTNRYIDKSVAIKSRRKWLWWFSILHQKEQPLKRNGQDSTFDIIKKPNVYKKGWLSTSWWNWMEGCRVYIEKW